MSCLIIGNHTQGLGILRSLSTKAIKTHLINEKVISLSRFSKYLSRCHFIRRHTLKNLYHPRNSEYLLRFILDLIPNRERWLIFAINFDKTLLNQSSYVCKGRIGNKFRNISNRKGREIRTKKDLSRLKENMKGFLDENENRMNRMKRTRECNYPTIFGMGITNESVKLLTGDLGYMNIFLNLGVLGLIFVIWIYIYLYKKCFKLINTISDDFYSIVIIGIIGIVSGMIIAGINFDYFTIKSNFSLLFLCIVTVELIDKFNRKGII